VILCCYVQVFLCSAVLVFSCSDVGVLVFSCTDVLVVWYSGVLGVVLAALVFRCSDLLVFWSFAVLEFWYSGVLLRYCSVFQVSAVFCCAFVVFVSVLRCVDVLFGVCCHVLVLLCSGVYECL